MSTFCRSLGQTCSDPGTPADSRQMADNYALGSVVSFECIRSGYDVVPNYNYTCVVDGTGDGVEWDDIKANPLPECLGMFDCSKCISVHLHFFLIY